MPRPAVRPTVPVVAVTAGDPCGIGPEVLVKALAPVPDTPLVILGDLRVFEQTARRLRRRLPPWDVRPVRTPWIPPRRLLFLDCGTGVDDAPGRSSASAGRASLAYLEAAVALQRRGAVDALVTAPITKWAIQRIRPGFVGQTEYLAEAMGAREVVMMFVSDRLRVALVTRHLPLARVPSAVTARLLRASLRLTADALRRQFRIPHPRLVLCGLNPHAGEGKPASEEQHLMRPVLRALAREGLRCDGPVAADGFFAAGHAYDAVVCLYHDQGLIPFKLLARDRGCQLSVGLPVPRTSPDHGSALDIAGRGIANAGSMRYALRLALRLARDAHRPRA